ncbi:MAG: MgtC/SapB family protein [Candidatus Omnitrophica bacterium]|nr:MgtC/SapB family protein [Candidatus Omnitrophota bacterium]
MTGLVLLCRFILSAILGGLIGIERELHGCAAGLRTHILVGIGSTLFMITSVGVATEYSQLGVVDPSRIAAGVVTGIGFLGAGAIIRYGTSVRGLTTAASIWAVAAIGLAVGIGMYTAASITTAIALTVLIISRIEELSNLKRQGKQLSVELLSGAETNIDDVKNLIEVYGGKIKRMVPKKEGEDGEVKYVFYVILPRFYRTEVVFEIGSFPGVKEVHWE